MFLKWETILGEFLTFQRQALRYSALSSSFYSSFQSCCCFATLGSPGLSFLENEFISLKKQLKKTLIFFNK